MFVVQMHASSLFNHATLEEEVALARKVCVRGMPMAKVKVKGTAHSACAWSRRLTIPASAGLWLECLVHILAWIGKGPGSWLGLGSGWGMKDPSDDSLGNGLIFSSVRDASYLLKSGGSCA